MPEKINKIVLAYSGGLDTSVMLRWLKDKYQCEIVCYCADVGQGAEMDGLEEKAKATGASKLYVEDLREEFVRDYVWTSVKANAIYEGVYLMGTSLARPVIAKRQIEIAQNESADAVASRLNSSHVSISYAVFCLKKKISNEHRTGEPILTVSLVLLD